jgi:hypothetical protein
MGALDHALSVRCDSVKKAFEKSGGYTGEMKKQVDRIMKKLVADGRGNADFINQMGTDIFPELVMGMAEKFVARSKLKDSVDIDGEIHHTPGSGDTFEPSESDYQGLDAEDKKYLSDRGISFSLSRVKKIEKEIAEVEAQDEGW